jgi:ferrous iron transport protein B
MRVVLVGNPNVGKSVVFSRFTGSDVTSSNYSGTTVEYTRGKMYWQGEQVEVIDAPGTYSMSPTSRAEEVACEMVETADVVLNVIDATNLERNLNVTLELLSRNVPTVVLLNMWDEAQRKGIVIDYDELSDILGVPVIPTVATKGDGLRAARMALAEVDRPSFPELDSDERWERIGKIVNKVQTMSPRDPTLLELLETASVRPLTGLPMAAGVLYLSFVVIRFIGEGIIGYITEPFFETFWAPVLMRFSDMLGGGGLIHDILVGRLIDGGIDFGQSFGLLSTGIAIPLASVLPYIVAFYFVLGILEDVGYLPRISVLVDNVMHQVGLHGFSIIPMILGLGCNVPAALATRVLEGRREKFITSTLMAISVPCMAQIAMIVGLLGVHGGSYLLYVFGFLAWIWLLVGTLMARLLPGFSTDLLLEIPPFRIPSISVVLKKLWIRIVSFLGEAIPFLLAGVFAVNLLYVLGVFDLMTQSFGPFLTTVFGLPQEAISALMMGFLRKDLAMGLLAPLALTPKQLLVASVVLAVYFPCVATFMVLIRELGPLDMLKSAVMMVATAVFVGAFINFAFQGGALTPVGWLIAVGMVFLARRIPLESAPLTASKPEWTDA